MTETTAEQAQDVRDAYDDALDSILELTEQIDRQAWAHRDRAGDSPDWGDVGDLNAIAEQLRNITEGK